MQEPKWVELLDLMYRDLTTRESTAEVGSGILRIVTKSDSDDLKHFLELTEYNTKEDLRQALGAMESAGLITTIETTDSERNAFAFALTEMGMQVAHERTIRSQQLQHETEQRQKERDHREEIAEQQRKVTKKTGAYTLFLVLAVATQSLVASLEIPGWRGVAVGIIVLALVIMVSIELWDLKDDDEFP